MDIIAKAHGLSKTGIKLPEAPIKTFSFVRTTRLQEWLRNQPDCEHLAAFKDETLRCVLAYPLTLAWWLHEHLDHLANVKGREFRIAIIGAADFDYFPAQYYRFIPKWLGLQREIKVTLIGFQIPDLQQLLRGRSGGWEAVAIKDDWQNHESRLIREGLDAAFLFHPGFHQYDFLQKGTIKPMVLKQIPVGMASYTVDDGENDDLRLREFGLRLEACSCNPFLMEGIYYPMALGALWDIELDSKQTTLGSNPYERLLFSQEQAKEMARRY